MSLTSDLHYRQKTSYKKIITQTLASVFYPEVFLLLFLPLVISVVVVTIIFVFAATAFSSFLQIGFQATIDAFSHAWYESYFAWLAPAFPFIYVLFLIALAFPMIIVCNLLITSTLTSGYLTKLIAKRDFKGLKAKGRSRFVEGFVNSLSAVLIYLLAWFVTLPLWFIPGVQIVLPVLLTGWLNRRVCGFDALTDFATDSEFSEIRAETKNKSYVVGLLTAGFNYVPLAFLVSPVFTMVAFIYFQLNNLQAKRSAASE